MDESPKVTKFDAKSQEGIFVGYSKSSKAYRVFLPNQKIVIESVHVKFNETTNLVVEKGIEIVGEAQPKELVNNTKNSQGTRVENEDESPQVDHGSEDQNVGNEETTPTPTQDEQYHIPENLREVPSHPLTNVIGNPREGVKTRSKHHSLIAHCAFVS